MLHLLFLVASVWINLTTCTELKLISTIRTSILAKYENYVDALLFPIVIPKEASFVAMKFTAEEIDVSFFNKKCPSRRVSLYMKYGAPPVINPDGSKFPESFKPISRENIFNLEFDSDKSANFINITSPMDGSYMAVVFLAAGDDNSAITQQGLTSVCHCYVEAKIFIEQTENVEIIVDEQEMGVTLTVNESKFYKFAVPDVMDQAIVILENVKFSKGDQKLVGRIGINRIPSEKTNATLVELNSTQTEGEILFSTVEGAWHYLELLVPSDNNEKSDDVVSLTFKVRFFTTQETSSPDTLIKMYANYTEEKIYYNNTMIKRYKAYDLSDSFTYKEYELVRDSSTENFLFSYLLEDEVDSPLPVALNLTNTKMSVMKFRVYDTDIGGTANFVIAFKSQLGRGRRLKQESVINHRVVACIRPYRMEIPFNPGDCYVDGASISSPMTITESGQNGSIQIPFPEAGMWFVSFRVFCGECEPCSCPNECDELFKDCMAKCYKNCNGDQCRECRTECMTTISNSVNCKSCADCDGPCKRSDVTCESIVVLDISSEPCVGGTCGANGKCAFMISSGVAYSTCLCMNNYRGWDCGDASWANPFYMVVLEWLLLVLSNLAFLPAIVTAVKRKYHVEAIVYTSICFFSSFYHACDAGENRISFCLTRKSSLQFADFFCALLSVWVTLIAMADLPSILPNIFHIAGAIVIAFITTVDKMSLWVLIVPSSIGVLIVIFSWTFKYRKVRQLFCKKNYLRIYLPVGIALVLVGLFIFSFLQTTATYKYLHSLWHIIVAVAIVILLPKRDTFQPDEIL